MYTQPFFQSYHTSIYGNDLQLQPTIKENLNETKKLAQSILHKNNKEKVAPFFSNTFPSVVNLDLSHKNTGVFINSANTTNNQRPKTEKEREEERRLLIGGVSTIALFVASYFIGNDFGEKANVETALEESKERSHHIRSHKEFGYSRRFTDINDTNDTITQKINRVLFNERVILQKRKSILKSNVIAKTTIAAFSALALGGAVFASNALMGIGVFGGIISIAAFLIKKGLDQTTNSLIKNKAVQIIRDVNALENLDVEEVRRNISLAPSAPSLQDQNSNTFQRYPDLNQFPVPNYNHYQYSN